MDWFDAYLDNLSDGKNVVYPPDSHTWRPVKPTKQQQSLIQDSMVFDVQQMRLIKEARQQEEEQGMGGSYDAGSASKEGHVLPTPTPSPSPSETPTPTPSPSPSETPPPTPSETPTPTPSPAPPGIPIDAENMLPAQLIVTFADVTDSLFSFHPSPTFWAQLGLYQYSLIFDGVWLLYRYNMFIGDNDFVATNPSTDQNNIPLTNWSYTVGTGNPVSISVA